jgi:hypothetical protein
MKTSTQLKLWLLAFVLVCLAAWLCHAALPTGPMPVKLGWNYPTNQLSPDLVFKLYTSTNLTTPLTNWTWIGTTAGANTSMLAVIQPGAQFFVLTASNFWGESDFSNVASTPPLPAATNNLTIGRGW